MNRIILYPAKEPGNETFPGSFHHCDSSSADPIHTPVIIA